MWEEYVFECSKGTLLMSNPYVTLTFLHMAIIKIYIVLSDIPYLLISVFIFSVSRILAAAVPALAARIQKSFAQPSVY